jgi:hypothetical protein
VRLKGLSKLKKKSTSSGLEPATCALLHVLFNTSPTKKHIKTADLFSTSLTKNQIKTADLLSTSPTKNHIKTAEHHFNT